MSKILELNADHEEQLCEVAKALSVPARIQILKLLYYNSFNIGEIAEQLHIPASTAALHIRTLESAGLINTEQQPGSRGSMKLCSRKNDFVSIRLVGTPTDVDQVTTISMPVGAYTDCEILPTCGLADEKGVIGYEDRPADFFLPARMRAQLLWTSGGYVEYKFPYPLGADTAPKQLLLTFEACSEVANYREDWKSDLTIWINGRECGTWRSPGDFGARRGRLTPAWWESGATQYGLLVTVAVSGGGCLINNQPAAPLRLEDLELGEHCAVTVRIGNKKGAEYEGGFNLFGEKFGDFEQDIKLSLVY